MTTAASQDEQPQARPAGATRSDPQPQQAVRIEKLLGSPVVNSKGHKVGKIEDVVLDQTGNTTPSCRSAAFSGSAPRMWRCR